MGRPATHDTGYHLPRQSTSSAAKAHRVLGLTDGLSETVSTYPAARMSTSKRTNPNIVMRRHSLGRPRSPTATCMLARHPLRELSHTPPMCHALHTPTTRFSPFFANGTRQFPRCRIPEESILNVHSCVPEGIVELGLSIDTDHSHTLGNARAASVLPCWTNSRNRSAGKRRGVRTSLWVWLGRI